MFKIGKLLNCLFRNVLWKFKVSNLKTGKCIDIKGTFFISTNWKSIQCTRTFYKNKYI